jgi:F-BAR domain only protein
MLYKLQHFQDVEEAHLKQMKEFIMMYIEIVQNNHDLVGQVRDLLFLKKKLTSLITFHFILNI